MTLLGNLSGQVDNVRKEVEDMEKRFVGAIIHYAHVSANDPQGVMNYGPYRG